MNGYYGYGSYYYPSGGAWPSGYVGQESSGPSPGSTGTELHDALVQRVTFLKRHANPGMLVAPPTPLELADHALQFAIAAYWEGAGLTGPQIKARIQQMLTRIRT